MKFFDRFFTSRTANPIQDAWNDVLSTLVTNSWNRPNTADLENAFARNPIVFAAIREISEVIAGATIEADPITTTLLEHPNPNQSWSEFSELMVASYLTTGRAYARIVRLGSRPSELYHVPSSMVDVDPVTGMVRINGVPFYSADLISMVNPSIEALQPSQPPILASWRDITIYDALLVYAQKTMLKLPNLNAVVETLTPTNQIQRNQLGTSIDNILGCDTRSTLVLPQNCKLSTPGVLADPSVAALARRCEANICSCLNVPPILVGCVVGMENSPWSNYTSARSSLYEETCPPIAGKLARAISRSLLVPVDLVINAPEPTGVTENISPSEMDPGVTA